MSQRKKDESPNGNSGLLYLSKTPGFQCCFHIFPFFSLEVRSVGCVSVIDRLVFPLGLSIEYLTLFRDDGAGAGAGARAMGIEPVF